jgi:transcriptional regulator with XRE-family HTH domain/ribosomal protein S27AE
MELTTRIREILRGRGLSLARVSSQSAVLFGRRSRYFIPEKMYYEISQLKRRPSMQQLVTLSRISGYRLSEWLRVFDVSLDDIPRLQLILPRRHTVLLDTSVYDEEKQVPWFVERGRLDEIGKICPLGRILAHGPHLRAAELLARSERQFLYARVGQDDAYAFPEIAPGSVVRINREAAAQALGSLGPACSKAVFLAAHGPRLHCGHLRRDREGRLALCSTHFPFSHIELGSGNGASILGVVDAEIRMVTNQGVPPAASSSAETEAAADVRLQATRLNTLIRTLRARAGLSLHEASKFSRSIASLLGNSRYFAASGTLSDYENRSRAPRSVHKIVSLCVLYSMGFWNFMEAAEFPLEQLGSDHIPETVEVSHSRSKPRNPNRSTIDAAGNFLRDFLGHWREIPVFLQGALDAVTGLKNLSLSDIYWVGAEQTPIHPLLVNASLVAVNRRVKNPIRPNRKTLWEQPIYLILKRDGSYLCGCCTLDEQTLTIHSRPFTQQTALHLRNGIDAEVIGQVTAILRHTA